MSARKDIIEVKASTPVLKKIVDRKQAVKGYLDGTLSKKEIEARGIKFVIPASFPNR